MALKARVFGLSAGSSRLLSGPDQAFVMKSVPFSSYCGVPLLRGSGQQLMANSELAQTRGIRLFIKTKHCNGQRVMLMQCDFCPVL